METTRLLGAPLAPRRPALLFFVARSKASEVAQPNLVNLQRTKINLGVKKNKSVFVFFWGEAALLFQEIN